LAQIDSNGYLEIAVNQGSAKKKLNAKIGTKIHLRVGIDLAQ
jgi:S-adenosylmethionine hydrolase